jgi:hypothetical protein
MSPAKQSQTLAIKLSRERRAGKEIPPPAVGQYSAKTRQKAENDLEVGRSKRAKAKSAKKKP